MSISVGRVGMIPTSSVIVAEDRAREIMGDLDSMESNMREIGLTSPLTMKDNKDGTFTLLAGERRFTVLKRNGVSEIPARIYEEDLSEIEMKIIEKSENFFRKDMEFYELDKLTLEIHQMQQSIHGTKAPGPNQSGWSVENTGEMIGGVSKATVSQSIKRAQLREQCPELFDGCKTASDAMGVIKKLDEAIIKQAIAKNLESNKTDNKMLAQLSKVFIVRNCFEGIKEVPTGSMHLVEIDPPYAIGIKEAKKKEGESIYTLEDYNEIPPSNYMDGGRDDKWLGMNTLFKECYRVMADHSWLLCWFGPEPWFADIYNALINAGFETTRMCPIWTKASGQTQRPEMHLPNSYEMFFYAWKGRPAIANPRRSNVFNYAPVPPQQKTHPTERPIEMMQDIYRTFAFPGSRILIPFLGSGNGLIAAYREEMSAVGFEIGKGYKDSFLVKVNSMK
jgi:DNA modification methylase